MRTRTDLVLLWVVAKLCALAPRFGITLVLFLAIGFTEPANAQRSADPRVPPGRDPGGVAIALISAGIDYTHPAIRDRLARDGEGDMIGLDLIDGDMLPFAPPGQALEPAKGGDGTALARLLLETNPRARLVAVRTDLANPIMVARAIAFVAKTPARIVAVPAWSRERGDWPLMEAVAVSFPHLLLVFAAGDPADVSAGLPQWPAAVRPSTALIVAPAPVQGPPTAAALAAVEAFVTVPQPPGPAHAVAVTAALAGCLHGGEAATGAADLKRLMLAAAAKEHGGATLKWTCPARR